MKKYHEKEFEELKEGPEVDILLESQRATHKEIWNWITPDYNGIREFWSKNSRPATKD